MSVKSIPLPTWRRNNNTGQVITKDAFLYVPLRGDRYAGVSEFCTYSRPYPLNNTAISNLPLLNGLDRITSQV